MIYHLLQCDRPSVADWEPVQDPLHPASVGSWDSVWRRLPPPEDPPPDPSWWWGVRAVRGGYRAGWWGGPPPQGRLALFRASWDRIAAQMLAEDPAPRGVGWTVAPCRSYPFVLLGRQGRGRAATLLPGDDLLAPR